MNYEEVMSMVSEMGLRSRYEPDSRVMECHRKRGCSSSNKRGKRTGRKRNEDVLHIIKCYDKKPCGYEYSCISIDTRNNRSKDKDYRRQAKLLDLTLNENMFYQIMDNNEKYRCEPASSREDLIRLNNLGAIKKIEVAWNRNVFRC